MRKLHVVGFTAEFDGLIFSTRKGSKSGGFVVAISDELLEKLAEVDRLRNGGESAPTSGAPGDEASRTRPQSELTPREIQARLRAGRTIDEVAKEARCTREWVERFAAPILAEQASVIELARSLTYSKARLGESALPLGSSVALNLTDKGSPLTDDEFNANWSAFQLHDGVWMVRFRYRSRGRSLTAAWELDVANGRLVSRDRVASDLAYVDGSRKRRATDEEEPPPEGSPGTGSQSSPGTVRASGAARRSSAVKAAPVPAVVKRRAAPSARTSTSATRTARTTRTGPPAKRSAASRPAASPKKAAKRPSKASTTVTANRPARSVAKKRAPVKRARASAAPASPVKRANAAKKSTAVAVKPAKRARATKPETSPAARRRAPAAKTAAPARGRAPAANTAKAVARPKIGTDGSRVVTVGRGSGGRRPSTPAVPRAKRAPGAASSGRMGSARRGPLPGGNGMQPTRSAPARSAPARSAPARSAPSPRKAATTPRPAPAKAAPPVRRSAAPSRSSSRAPAEERETPSPPVRASIFGDPPPRREEPEPQTNGDDLDRMLSGEDDAFVIRPRISAKQASELASSEERPRRFRERPWDSMTGSALPFLRHE